MSDLIELDNPNNALMMPQEWAVIRPSSNRADGYCQIEAKTDIEAVQTWLVEYQGNQHTFDAYRKESMRLIWWLNDRGKSLSEMTRNDVLDYERFLSDPQPAEKWVGPACGIRLRDGSMNPNWKPFVGPLSTRAIKMAMTVIGSLFTYLVNAGYLTGNPVTLKRRTGKKTGQKTQNRFLSQEILAFVLESIDGWPRDSLRQVAEYERAKWLMNILYYAGFRRSEVAEGVMGDFFYTQSHGRMYWWLGVFGKGFQDAEDDERNKVPVPEPLLAALKSYRLSLGLSELPSYKETFPLLPNIKNQQRMTPKAVYLIVKQIFERAALLATELGRSEYLPVLNSASTHWMRHTSATHQLDADVDIRVVQKNLRHADISTTMIYSHVESHKQHETTEQAFGKQK